MGPFLIIYGTRGVTYSAGQGQFHCPSCGKQPYQQRRVRRFFTLYFIPLIPLDQLGEYVECGQCRGTYETAVLDYDPEEEDRQFEAEFHRAIRRVMALICLADGVIDDEEVVAIRQVYESLTSTPMSDDAARAEIAAAQQDGASVSDYLSKVGAVLNDEGKAMIVRAAILIAAADGEFQDEEKALLAEIGKALRMSSAHVDGILQAMLREDPAAN